MKGPFGAVLIVVMAHCPPAAAPTPVDRTGDASGGMVGSVRSSTGGVVHRIGRFQFELPAAFKATGRHQAIYRAEVKTIAAKPGDAAARLAARLAVERTGPKPADVPERISRSFELAPDVPAIVYFSDPATSELTTLMTGKAFDDHYVLVSRSSEASAASKIEPLVAGVITGYVPGGREGFDVGAGTVTSVPGVNEEARLVLEYASLAELKIEFDSHTVREPREPERVETGGEASPIYRVLRSEFRSVAGLRGHETSVEFTHDGSLHWMWAFQGGAANPVLPAIMITASGRADDRATLGEAWESMLSSMQLIPLAPTPSRK